jgi:DNA-binding response OmpR family regulator
VATVLVVDDDVTVREVVATYLRREGLDVIEADDGLDALVSDAAHDPDLVVLDLMLPGLDGLEVFRRMRSRRGSIPIIMLTARGDEDDRVLGLEVGADDYVAKPFSPRELVLRVQALLRRSRAHETNPIQLADGDLTLDPRARIVTRAGQPLTLTAREFDLLRHMMSTAGTVWSRTQLMNDVWGWEYGDESTVTVHVRRLREKVEDDPSRPTRLVTVWGVGYRWDSDEP